MPERRVAMDGGGHSPLAALKQTASGGRGYYDLGLVLAETNRPMEVEAAFRKAVTLEPKDVDLPRALSRQLEKNGKGEEARKVLEQLLSLDPADPEAKHQLQRLQEQPASTQLHNYSGDKKGQRERRAARA